MQNESVKNTVPQAHGGGRQKKGNAAADWVFRLFKGAVIGTGFIIPGVSGGETKSCSGLMPRKL